MSYRFTPDLKQKGSEAELGLLSPIKAQAEHYDLHIITQADIVSLLQMHSKLTVVQRNEDSNEVGWHHSAIWNYGLPVSCQYAYLTSNTNASSEYDREMARD